MTGPLERPSQGALENRKAEQKIQPTHRSIAIARKTTAAIGAAELQLLLARQRALRTATMQSVSGALAARHASATAAIIGRFAARRAAIAGDVGPAQRTAALARIAEEEATELARQALVHGAEKRALRQATLAPILLSQRAERRQLRKLQRRARAVQAIHWHRALPRRRAAMTARRHRVVARPAIGGMGQKS